MQISSVFGSISQWISPKEYKNVGDASNPVSIRYEKATTQEPGWLKSKYWRVMRDGNDKILVNIGSVAKKLNISRQAAKKLLDEGDFAKLSGHHHALLNAHSVSNSQLAAGKTSGLNSPFVHPRIEEALQGRLPDKPKKLLEKFVKEEITSTITKVNAPDIPTPRGKYPGISSVLHAGPKSSEAKDDEFFTLETVTIKKGDTTQTMVLYKHSDKELRINLTTGAVFYEDKKNHKKEIFNPTTEEPWSDVTSPEQFNNFHQTSWYSLPALDLQR
jgi:hypothetical protein